MPAQKKEQPARTPTLTSREGVEQFVGGITSIMDELENLLTEETSLVRAARLFEASQMVGSKSALYVDYVRALERLRSEREALSQLAPDLVEALRARHARLQETLAINLAVLGTAKAVSEDIIRSVAEEVTASASPQTYTSGGRNQGTPRNTEPLSVSKIF
jgi:hypothetical protein